MPPPALTLRFHVALAAAAPLLLLLLLLLGLVSAARAGELELRESVRSASRAGALGEAALSSDFYASVNSAAVSSWSLYQGVSPYAQDDGALTSSTCASGGESVQMHFVQLSPPDSTTS